MTELEYMIDLHKGTHRQGPGTEADTLRALEFTADLQKRSELRVADIGCGTGGQTLCLAKNLKAELFAVDLFDAFLNELRTSAAQKGLEKNIQCLQASMNELPFSPESLDLIWSEGAIYLMGFQKGIVYWRQFLKPGGFLTVSEITWLQAERPEKIDRFWQEAYPEIDTAEAKIAQLEKAGYRVEGHFFLSPESWQAYYKEVEGGFADFLGRHANSSEAQAVVEDFRKEMALYAEFKNYYSYGFYIAQKIE